ncbi:MAG TPA: FAD-dependent oxidoreductase [Acidimicrobiales bacterium]|nr:FAD-dependent oxidoreductase [Acidimicrobiales bacterium]
MTRAVIIGTGPAGITAAETLRRLDPAGTVTALTLEPFPPYSPAAMADHFLTGRDTTLYWKGRDISERLGVEERREAPVIGVDVDNNEVVLTGGDRIPYEVLIVASGSRLHAPIEGAELPGVLDFKSLRKAEALMLRVRSGEARNALIVGHGFIGVELALMLTDLGVSVRIVGRRPWVMPRVLDRPTSEFARAALEGRGVELCLGTPAEAFVETPTGTAVRLTGGQVLHADLVVAATGVKPHIEFLDGAGIVTNWGVHVDDHMRSGIPSIYAAGDVAEAADWLTGERYVHAIFPNAVAQAKIAAANALGADITYDGAESMNSLKHLGVPIVAMGTTDGADDVIHSENPGMRRSVFLREGRIIGAQLAGDITSAGVYHSLMLRRADVRPYGSHLASPSFGFASVVSGALWPPLAS